MKLDIQRPQVGGKSSSNPWNWAVENKENQLQEELQPSTWVKLLELPSPFSFDEALLLCPCSEDKWIAWIPDHGEAVLHTSQFCLCN